MKKQWRMPFAAIAASILLVCNAGDLSPLSVTVSGNDISVGAAAGVLDDTSALYLVWDTSDHGDDLADWPAENRIAYSGSPAVSSAAATYTLDKSSVPDGAYMRVLATSNVRLIDGYVKLGASQYVNTGVKDTAAYGFEIRYRPTSTKTGNNYASLMGGVRDKFTVGMNNSNYDKYYIRYGAGTEVGNPAYVLPNKTDPHTVGISGAKLYLDGEQLTTKPDGTSALGSMSGTLGRVGVDILLGVTWDSTAYASGTLNGNYCHAEWYYAALLDNSGAALANLVPALRGDAASPEAVFYDTVSGTCIANAGTGTLAYSGSTTNTVACAAGASDAIYNGRVATWTGGGDTSDATDPDNWSITYCGAAVADAIPADGTKIAGCTLAADADWSAIAQTNCEITGTIELAGHSLTVGGLAGTGTITDSTGGGELHVSVGSGLSVTNDGIALTGSLKLVKEGAGTLVGAMTGQTYTGGTLVSAGRAKCAVADSPWGAALSLVTIADGATFDWAGAFTQTGSAYNFALAGSGTDGNGALVSTGLQNTWNVSTIADMELLGDARIGGYGGWGFSNVNGSWTAHALTMNGHTLSISLKGNGSYNTGMFAFRGVTTSGSGTIAFVDAMSSRVFPSFFGSASDLSSATLDFGEGYLLNLDNESYLPTVGTYIDRRTGNAFDVTSSKRSYAITVLDSFKPMATNLVRTVVLGDATHLSPVLDLSALDGPFVVPSANYSIGMASGAMVQVRLGDRKVSGRTPIVTWAGEKPEWVDALRIANGDADRQYGIVVKDDGIYAVTGLVISVR